MNQTQVDQVFIKNVADSIRSLIKMKDFYHSVVDYFMEKAEFPPDIDQQVINNYLDNEHVDDQVLDNYIMICNRKNIDELYQLHTNIFSLMMSSSSSASSLNIGDEDDNEYGDFDNNENNNNNINFVSKPKYQQISPITSINQLGENQINSISVISQKYQIHPEIVEALYQLFKFDTDSLTREISINLQANLEKIGLQNHSIILPIHFKKHKKRSENETCLICYNDEESGIVLYSLPCQHYFCWECITEHIQNSISNGKTEIICPHDECNCRIVRKDIIKFCGYKLAVKNFNKTIEKEIETKSNFFHCGREGCPSILTISSVGLGDVATCSSCGFRLCWKCKEISHAPLDCKLLPKWKEIAKEENAELKWIKENTKACPNCHERIQRDGGCTYIKCPRCSYEFCYVCGGPFPAHANHNASCNVYRDYDNVTLPDGVDMNRLSFYLTRFLSNKVSHENEIKQREKNQNKLLHIFNQVYDIPYERLQFNDAMKLTNDIFNAIDEARSILMWSYPHAFFMNPGSNELKIFEYVQGDLGSILENLVNMVENDEIYESPRKYRQIVNQLKSYSKSLMLHVYGPLNK